MLLASTWKSKAGRLQGLEALGPARKIVQAKGALARPLCGIALGVGGRIFICPFTRAFAKTRGALPGGALKCRPAGPGVNYPAWRKWGAGNQKKRRPPDSGLQRGGKLANKQRPQDTIKTFMGPRVLFNELTSFLYYIAKKIHKNRKHKFRPIFNFAPPPPDGGEWC